MLLISILVQYDKLSKHPAEARYDEVLEWLRKTPESEKLEFADSLKRHFPNGPASEEEEKIDVIAVTDSCAHSVLHPSTVVN